MSNDTDELVRVPFGGEGKDRAILLLDAAEKLGLDANVVGTDTQGNEMAFHAPASVVAKAFGKGHDYETVDVSGNPQAEQAEVPDELPEDIHPEPGEAIVQPPNAAGEAHPGPEPAIGEQAKAKAEPAKKTAAKRPARKRAAKKTAAKKTAKKAS